MIKKKPLSLHYDNEETIIPSSCMNTTARSWPHHIKMQKAKTCDIRSILSKSCDMISQHAIMFRGICGKPLWMSGYGLMEIRSGSVADLMES
jgi:hypothetical protein